MKGSYAFADQGNPLYFWTRVSVLLESAVLPGGELNRNLFNPAPAEVLCYYTLPWHFSKSLHCACVYFNFSLQYTQYDKLLVALGTLISNFLIYF